MENLLQKIATTIHLDKMNLAAHGLAGDTQKATSYYEGPHELLHKAEQIDQIKKRALMNFRLTQVRDLLRSRLMNGEVAV